ncbi:unnamed protein product [Cuscuta epithymum]|uniref:Ubiquitin-like protease family profile domain-containing protein n=1 Tax=Cuscuta epithymum TaxID=186058 RepID=A0AAV0F822_9ASTE|nr:unnamed protein product [Cuscuta epithymum]
MVELGEMPVQFGTSAAIACPKRLSDESVTRRSQYISDILSAALPGQITLIPYNAGDHWVLGAIDLEMSRIYYLDSIGDTPAADFELIMNQGVKIYQAAKSNKRLTWSWLTVTCPKQKGSIECGYFVMKYIKDIVGNVNVLKNNFSAIMDYSEHDILQIREEWASYAATLVKD